MIIAEIMPLGQIPRWLYIEQRVELLKDTMHNYIDADLCIPTEINREYNQLIEEKRNLHN